MPKLQSRTVLSDVLILVVTCIELLALTRDTFADSAEVQSQPPNFSTWCEDHGVYLHAGLGLEVRSSAGARERWLRANSRIAPGEEVAVAPRSALLSSRSLPPPLLQALHQNLPEGYGPGVPEMVALAILLLAEAAHGGTSPYAAYIDSLPSAEELQPAVTWPDASLKLLPQRAYLSAKLTRQTLRRIVDTVLPSVIAAEPNFVVPGALSWPRFLWAYGIVSSRSFNLSSFTGIPSGSGGLVLFPGGDLLNHSPNASIAYLYEADYDLVTIRTLLPIKTGEEVYNNYGRISSSTDLLLGWGFLIGTPQEDHVIFQLPKPHGPEASKRLMILKRLGLLAYHAQAPFDDLAQVAAVYQVKAGLEGSAAAAHDLLLCWCVLLAEPVELGNFMARATARCRDSRAEGCKRVPGALAGSAQCRINHWQHLHKRAQAEARKALKRAAKSHLSEADSKQLAAALSRTPSSMEDRRRLLALQLRSIHNQLLLAVANHATLHAEDMQS